MTATLIISSQGQVTLKKEIREALGVKSGSKLLASVTNTKTGVGPSLILEPEPKSWYKAVAGTGKGLWGENSDEYIRKERESWNRE